MTLNFRIYFDSKRKLSFSWNNLSLPTHTHRVKEISGKSDGENSVKRRYSRTALYPELSWELLSEGLLNHSLATTLTFMITTNVKGSLQRGEKNAHRLLLLEIQTMERSKGSSSHLPWDHPGRWLWFIVHIWPSYLLNFRTSCVASFSPNIYLFLEPHLPALPLSHCWAARGLSLQLQSDPKINLLQS